MIFLFMHSHVASLRKSFVTFTTLKWFVASMYSFMFCQCCFLDETFSACSTHVRLLSRVRHDMAFHTKLCGKPFAAHTAYKSKFAMALLMLSHWHLMLKFFATIAAHEHISFMRFAVFLETSSLLVLLPTYFASIYRFSVAVFFHFKDFLSKTDILQGSKTIPAIIVIDLSIGSWCPCSLIVDDLIISQRFLTLMTGGRSHFKRMLYWNRGIRSM